MRHQLPILTLLLSLPLSAGAETPGNGCWNLYEEGEQDVGYCQAYRSGNTLYISGSVGAGEMPGAITSAYNDLRKTLEAFGLGFEHVVMETVYATDLDEFIANKDVRKSYYSGHFPAASWVQVERLFVPALVVEVDVIAKFPDA